MLAAACESFWAGIEVLLPALQANQEASLPLFGALWGGYQACLAAEGSEPNSQRLSQLETLFPLGDGQEQPQPIVAFLRFPR